MRAMILAAGYGRRLAPLTDVKPKALIEVGGRPLLEILLRRLERQGFTEIAVNLYHFAEKIIDFLNAYRKTSNTSLYISSETELLDTGGGIKKMLDFFPGNDPILVHNVDVLCDCRLDELIKTFIHIHHCEALLAVLPLSTNRPLCFDCEMNFKGRGNHNPTKSCRHYAFTGIHVIRPSLYREHPADKFYNIDLYVHAAAAGRAIKGTLLRSTYWRDVGRLEDLFAAEKDTEFLKDIF